MDVLVLHYIEILIGHILALVFLNAHDELAVDYLLRVLVGSHACVYELDQLSHVF